MDGIHFLTALLANSPQPLLVLDKNQNVKMANHAFCTVFKIQNPIGHSIHTLGSEQWNIPELHNLLDDLIPQHKIVSDYDLKLSMPGIGERRLRLNAEDITYSTLEKLTILHIEDITDGIRAGEADAMLGAIVQSSEDAIISKTLKGILTTWNGAAEKLFGYTSAEMIGQPILKVIPQDRINEEPEIIRKIERGETIAHFETQRLSKNNKLVDISLTISPIKDRTGRIIGTSKIARNISQQIDARKKIEESEKRFHQLIYSSPTGICILEGDQFHMKAANQPIIEIWGKGQEVIGRKYFELLPELFDKASMKYSFKYIRPVKYSALSKHHCAFYKTVCTLRDIIHIRFIRNMMLIMR